MNEAQVGYEAARFEGVKAKGRVPSGEVSPGASQSTA